MSQQPTAQPGEESGERGELELRDRILAGDREAAGALFQTHFEGLYEFVHYRVGGDRGLAEDIVQDTFVVALEALESFDGRSSLHTWLCGIAKNKLRERRRKRKAVPLSDVLDEASDDIDAVLARVSSEPLPDWVLERKETRELVGATLSNLPPDYRRALAGKYLKGESVAQISVALAKTPKATESLLTRARLAFAEVFELLAKRRGGVD
ncbi:MAG: RNA polymerase sigma factor [Planctomycetota bacterium]|nr:RNA polymerase sigma factor [Planctomycetota bacterium]